MCTCTWSMYIRCLRFGVFLIFPSLLCILSKNLPCAGGLYGRGVYFTDESCKSDSECTAMIEKSFEIVAPTRSTCDYVIIGFRSNWLSVLKRGRGHTEGPQIRNERNTLVISESTSRFVTWSSVHPVTRCWIDMLARRTETKHPSNRGDNQEQDCRKCKIGPQSSTKTWLPHRHTFCCGSCVACFSRANLKAFNIQGRWMEA